MVVGCDGCEDVLIIIPGGAGGGLLSFLSEGSLLRRFVIISIGREIGIV